MLFLIKLVDYINVLYYLSKLKLNKTFNFQTHMLFLSIHKIMILLLFYSLENVSIVKIHF